MKTMTQNVKWMLRENWPDVLRLMRQSPYLWHWSAIDLERCSRQKNCIGLVHFTDEVLTGFTIYELHKHKITVVVECGSDRALISLLSTLKGKLSPLRRTSIELLMCDTQTDQHIILRDLGFTATGVIRKHFDINGDWRDAYRFEFHLQKDSVCVSPVLQRH